MKKQNTIRIRSDARNGLLFCLPWIVGFLALSLYPIIMSVVYSFSDVTVETDGIKIEPYGWGNFTYALVNDSAFVTALKDYAIKIVLYVPVITVVSLIIALLLNSKVKGKGFFRTLFFLPVIITSGPVISIFIDKGVAEFSGIATLIDFEALSATVPQFLVSALKFLTSEFIMILWFCGIQILVFMTGLNKLDKSMYEAAAIDGASKWEAFWKLTLPSINPFIVINVVFTIIMQSMFSLNPVISKIQADMNASGEGAGYGYSSAMSWIYFLVLVVLLVVFVLIFKKKERRRVR
ncbi:MAG: sugar ABC transporter permease [Clostridia bacterium]|nr:sugar ABC transporter permease [Clostridia bacterium]